MKKAIGIIIVGLLLAGCASEAKYRSLLDTWVGSTEDELVSVWGVPQGVYTKNNGDKLIQYSRSGTVTLPGSSTTTGTISPYGTFSSSTSTTGPTTIPYSCTTTFTISPNGKIQTWNFRGNSCISD